MILRDEGLTLCKKHGISPLLEEETSQENLQHRPELLQHLQLFGAAAEQQGNTETPIPGALP